MGSILVAGHVCLDLTPQLNQQAESDHQKDWFTPGKLVQSGNMNLSLGGVVANTGLALKLFDVDVKLVAKIGDDPLGGLVKRLFMAQGTGEDLIMDAFSSTSYSVVLSPPGRDRMFLHQPGANDRFDGTEITDALLKDVRLLHFGYPTLMAQMYAHEGAALIALYQRLKTKHIVTSLDLAMMDASSLGAKADWNQILNNVLPYVDIFVPSAEELCCLLDPERYQDWLKRGDDVAEHLDVMTDVAPLGQQVMAMGVKILLIKCGVQGLYYCTANKGSLTHLSHVLNPEEWAGQQGHERCYEPDQVLSATGAGDTTVAAFLAAILRGYSLDHCLRLATAAGASNVTAYDAISGLCTFDVLEEKISQGWLKKGDAHVNQHE